jgi:SSS family solute:Na+ symporter
MFGLIQVAIAGRFGPLPDLLALSTAPLAHLRPLDIAVIAIYFGMVIWIGFYLKGRSNTSEEFFMAGREMTAWIAGLSFVSANLGSLELMGWAGSAYQYGILATHWYWVGAIPAMIFLGVVMMPFYYVSKTHSVPGYLMLRFGEHARILAAISFAAEMVLMSGVNMFAMAVVMKVVLGWNITFSILVSSIAVAAYVGLGGLRSAIFNEVLQFVLIWGGALLVPILGMVQAGGTNGLKMKIIANMHTDSYFHLWRDTGHFSSNPMGVQWTGIVFGLSVIGFGYWTTDFLVVQRTLAAHNLRAARMAPIIGSFFKMAVPFIVILPGLLGLVLLKNPDGSRRVLVGEDVVNSCAVSGSQDKIEVPSACLAAMAKTRLSEDYQGRVLSGAPAAQLHSYNEALPLMMVRYLGPGLLGLGITALIAGFMSGMAGNVSAFSTVWTYDIYKPLINRRGSDSHYVLVGRLSIIIGVAVSIGAAYLVMHAHGIMDYVQALFSFFIAPLLGAILMGMFWRRATAPAGFLGLLSGIITSVSLFIWVKFNPAELASVALSSDAKPMAENLYRALWAFLITVLVIFVVSLVTKPKPIAALDGLVYGVTKLPKEDPVPFYKSVWLWALLAIVILVILNILFW